ncbi:MAG: hypothetical protein ABW044_02455, partial [Cellvibrio sp.]
IYNTKTTALRNITLKLNNLNEDSCLKYQRAKICLLGDFSDKVLAHQAINLSFIKAEESSEFAENLTPEWVLTRDIKNNANELAEQFSQYDGVWVVPASPYENTEGVLAVIQFLRTQGIPFLGTCGGYQHAIIEFARNVLSITDAEHAELNPDARSLLIIPLACKLVEKSETLSIKDDTLIRQFYGSEKTSEMYHCSFGFNDSYMPQFSNSNMKFAIFNEDGHPRAFELRGHPFFIGTAFQPERSSFNGIIHPIVSNFFQTVTHRKNLARQTT